VSNNIYHPVTAEELEAALAEISQVSFERIRIERVRERVYQAPVARDCWLVCYSSIVDGEARGVGEDAIRFVVFYRGQAGTKDRVVMKAKRVHRITTWRKNLAARVESILKWIESMKCSRCGSLMMVRDGKFGAFAGCVRYPDCTNTRKP
jgi:hypothetical protein